MNRVFAVLVAVLVATSATVARAETALSVEALDAVAQLRAASGPGLTTVVRDGRIRWAGSIEAALGGGAPGEAARSFVLRHAAAFGLDPADDLEEVASREVGGTRYIRFQQRHDGRPIIGAQAVVSVRDGHVHQVTSGLVRSASAWPASTIRAADAARAVERQSGRGAVVPGADDVAWLSLGRGALLPVWIVTQRSAAPPRDWRYLVEATTGAVIWRYDQYLRADGNVWETNPVESRFPIRVELPGLPDGSEVLEGELAQSFRCVASTGDCSWTGRDCRVCGVSEHLATADEDGNFLYDPEEPSYDDPFSEVQAYYHAALINEFFGDVLGAERTCGGSRQVTIYVNQHYPGDDLQSANAFYGDSDGDGCGDLTMGEGQRIDFAYDADVIYHEFTHGIVEFAGGLGCAPMGPCPDSLGIDNTAIGLNEGFADYFAVSYTDDPELGEHAGSAFTGEGSIRNVENDHLCPFDLVGESHYDGLILGATGWDVRTLLGAEIADRIMLATLFAIDSDSDYAVFAAALRQAAQDEAEAGTISEEDLLALEQILGPEGRGVTDCERIVPLDAIPEGHHEEYMQLYTFMGMSFPGPMQWSLTTPRRATSLEFELESMVPADRATVYVRAGEPVGVTMNFNESTMTLEVDFEADTSFDITRDALVLEPDSEYALQDETTYYFAIEYRCDSGCMLRARGAVEGEPNAMPVAEAGEDQEVELGDTVSLDGSASNDPDGDELTYLWEQIDGPAVELEGADGATPIFEASEAGDVVLQLTVTDEEGGSATDSVRVTVIDRWGGDPAVRFNALGGGCAAAPAGARLGLRRLLDLL